MLAAIVASALVLAIGIPAKAQTVTPTTGGSDAATGGADTSAVPTTGGSDAAAGGADTTAAATTGGSDAATGGADTSAIPTTGGSDAATGGADTSPASSASSQGQSILQSITSSGTKLDGGQIKGASGGPECGGCSCENSEQIQTQGVIKDQENQTRMFVTQEFEKIQDYMVQDFYILYVRKAWKEMTEQLITNGNNQMMALGAFYDARIQMDTQRLLQQKTAEAHKNYQTSTEMCVMGTAATHMLSTDKLAVLSAHVLSKRSMDRQLGNGDAEGGDGPMEDTESRMANVRSLYCNQADNNNEMKYICPQGGIQQRRNRDIDYARVMGDSSSLEINVSNATLTDDEEDLFALQNYLYVNHPFSRIPATIMGTEQGQQTWMDMRSIIAKHQVAESSFDNVMGMKSSAADVNTDPGKYMGVILQRLGLSEDDAEKLISRSSTPGDSKQVNKPSYYAMLQVLGQQLYQSPSFYVNLYDTPANVQRKRVAMQAVNLVMDRESYASELREEQSLSQILESQVVTEQSQLQNASRDLQRRERANPK